MRSDVCCIHGLFTLLKGSVTSVKCPVVYPRSGNPTELKASGYTVEMVARDLAEGSLNIDNKRPPLMTSFSIPKGS